MERDACVNTDANKFCILAALTKTPAPLNLDLMSAALVCYRSLGLTLRNCYFRARVSRISSSAQDQIAYVGI